jgi:lipopolysaccharide export LptBFGC system permease protein LptF
VRTNVQLEMELSDGKTMHVAAEEARIECRDDMFVVRMKDAQVLTENANFQSAAPSYSWRFSSLFPVQPKDRSKAKYLTTPELRATLEADRLEPERRQEFRYEIHRRHALSATYLLFLLLGLPTGVVLRSSTQLGAFTIAVGYALLYYVLAMRLGKVLGDTGAIPPLVGAWATNGLFLLGGLVFSWRALWR